MDEALKLKIRIIDGWLFDEEAELLHKYGSAVPQFSTILELGSYCGKSTLALAYDSSASVYCVDTFMSDATTVQRQSTFEKFLVNTACCANVKGIPTTTEHAKLMQQFEWVIPPNIALLFIDADHSYEGVKKDFEMFGSSVELGGYVIFHDAYGENGEERNTPWPGVTQFCSELCRNTNWEFVEKCRRCAVFKRLK